MGGLLVVLFLACTILFVAIAAMAVGVIMRRPCLRGSCGGAAIHDRDGVRVCCATCTDRCCEAACRPPGGRKRRPNIKAVQDKRYRI